MLISGVPSRHCISSLLDNDMRVRPRCEISSRTSLVDVVPPCDEDQEGAADVGTVGTVGKLWI
jgi:hypothetical protein